MKYIWLLPFLTFNLIQCNNICDIIDTICSKFPLEESCDIFKQICNITDDKSNNFTCFLINVKYNDTYYDNNDLYIYKLTTNICDIYMSQDTICDDIVDMCNNLEPCDKICNTIYDLCDIIDYENYYNNLINNKICTNIYNLCNISAPCNFICDTIDNICKII